MPTGLFRIKDGWGNQHSVRVLYETGDEQEVPQDQYDLRGYVPPFDSLRWSDEEANYIIEFLKDDIKVDEHECFGSLDDAVQKGIDGLASNGASYAAIKDAETGTLLKGGVTGGTRRR